MRSAAIAVLALACCAPSYAAASSITPTQAIRGVAGPDFGGERVYWAERLRGEQWRLVAADGAGATVELARLRGTGVDVAATESRLSYGVSRVGWGDTGPIGGFDHVFFDEVWSGPPDGPWTRLARCEGGEGACPTRAWCHPSIEAFGETIAYGRCDGTSVLQHLGDDPFVRHLGQDSVAAIDGPLAVVYPFAPYNASVRDWRTDEELYVVRGEVFDADLDPDGRVAFTRWDERGRHALYVASPEAPGGEALGETVRRTSHELRLEAGRIAFQSSTRRLVVRDLAGGRIRSRVDRSAYGFDFDGRRLVWASIPCGVTQIVVWDTAGPEPAFGDRLCALPSVAGSSATVSPGSREVSFELSCPAGETLGCSGRARLVARRGTTTYRLAPRRYALPAGTSHTIVKRLSRGSRRFVRAGDEPAWSLQLTATKRLDQPRSEQLPEREAALELSVRR